MRSVGGDDDLWNLEDVECEQFIQKLYGQWTWHCSMGIKAQSTVLPCRAEWTCGAVYFNLICNRQCDRVTTFRRCRGWCCEDTGLGGVSVFISCYFTISFYHS